MLEKRISHDIPHHLKAIRAISARVVDVRRCEFTPSPHDKPKQAQVYDTYLLDALALDEGQEIGIDNVGMNRKHAVRVPRIDLQNRVLDQLCLQQDGVLVGYDLIVIALHHQGRRLPLGPRFDPSLRTL